MKPIQGFTLMLVGFFLSSPFSLSAQKVSSTERAVYELMDAGFLSSYKDHRSEIEERVAIFKSKKDDFSVEDLIRMKSAYKRTSEAFEDFIYGIRNDLLDKRARKRIKKDSEGYVTQQMEKLNTIYIDYYQGWFQPTYSAISDPESTVASNRGGGNITIPSALIAPVSQATMNVIEYLDKKNDKDLESVKKVLDREWLEPHQFTPWEEI